MLKILSIRKPCCFRFPFSSRSALPARLPFTVHTLTFLDPVLRLKNTPIDTLQKTLSEKLLAYQNKADREQFATAQRLTANLYQYICQDILREDDLPPDSEFMQQAHYYFQAEGKKIRPMMIYLTAANYQSLQHSQFEKPVKLWSSLVEILHIASLAHDDVIDDSPSRRGVASQHLKFGKKAAVFSGNYIISKASSKIYEFRSTRMYEIYSIAMENLAQGEILQAVAKNRNPQATIRGFLEAYMTKTYFKTAALMANALRAVPLLMGCPQQDQVMAFEVGLHFGMAFQIVDDIIDFISTADEMGKQPLQDYMSGNFTAPMLLALHRDASLNQSRIGEHIKHLKAKCSLPAEAASARSFVERVGGIASSYLLAQMHISYALEQLQRAKSPFMGAWFNLGLLILNRRK